MPIWISISTKHKQNTLESGSGLNDHIKNPLILSPFLFLFAFLILVFGYSCNSQDFSYEDYDYTLDSLEVGIAFPSVSSASDVAETVTAMTDLGTGWARIGFDWSFREPS